ncbi:MAG TPA: ShlB/FhaC/HecB family hemolysin secretion/activation protein [Phycisphaerae bacterium]|nr:ShlB/FhaC/HecB family hemolysin secretion/activation protein [Phycisphaerae bacterium]
MIEGQGVVARTERMMRQRYRAALVATGVWGAIWCGGGVALGQAGGRAVTPPDVSGGGGSGAPAAAVPGPGRPAQAPAAVPAAPENPTNNPPAVIPPAPSGAAAAPAPVQVGAQAAAATQNAPVSAGATDAAGAAAAGGRAVTPENVAAPGSPPSANSTPEIAPAPPTGVSATQGTGQEPVSAATGPAATQAANYRYPLTGIKVNYLKESAQQPPIDQLLSSVVELGVKDGAYVAPSQATEKVKVRLGEVGKGDIHEIERSGITALYGQIVHFYNDKGIIGVFVVVDAKDIDANDRDIRPADRKTLQFIVVTSTVKQVRTVLTGDKVPEGKRVDDPKHAWIREDSPLKADSTSSLLNKDALDEYVMRLNRQPGRRVDVAVSGAGELGGVTLDYLISENKPWYLYAQVSNTGTKQTNEWRERFGAVDNQLTGHDDILSIDYTTAGFTASHAVIGSYDVPLFSMDRLRYKVYASYNEFTASDVGQGQEQFSGDQWIVGNELVWNIFQHRELFIDAVGGVRGQGVSTNNITAQTTGSATYVAPYLGLRLDRTTDLASTTGDVTVIGYFTGTSDSQIEALGRAQPTKNPVVLEWDFAQSAYLEPLFDPNNFATGNSTLAHEVYVGFRGQYSPNRLFPQVEQVAGGFYSVRGYPESISAGDTVLIATAEYRFHFPRILPVQADPSKTPFLWDKRFRFSPQQVYGRPDWDLIARAFFDVGQVWNTDKLQFEQDQTLAGTGLGIELQYKQNFNVRVDWGFALIDVPDQVQAGDNRVHVSATFLY